jgi:hypothetical protein
MKEIEKGFALLICLVYLAEIDEVEEHLSDEFGELRFGFGLSFHREELGNDFLYRGFGFFE